MANYPSYNYPDIGVAGEELVAHWLGSQGWMILHHRWRCRWGEIDIIAQRGEEDTRTRGHGEAENFVVIPSPQLAFVEVKTRSPGNWDAGGRSAIAPQKQLKLWRAAQMFLVNYPEKAEHCCQFDVAIVFCQRISTESKAINMMEKALAISSINEYKLILQEYIPAAFESVDEYG